MDRLPEEPDHFDRLLSYLADDVSPPAKLDADTAALARAILIGEHPVLPGDATQARVWERVKASDGSLIFGSDLPGVRSKRANNNLQSAESRAPSPNPPVRRLTPLIRVAVAAAVILFLVGAASWWADRSQQVNAQEVLQKALANSNGSLDAVGVRSYHYQWASVEHVALPSGEQDTLSKTGEAWGTLPNRWRLELTVQSAGNGVVNTLSSGSDGNMQWDSYTLHGQAQVRIGALPTGATPPLPILLQLPSTGAPPELAVSTSQCYDRPKVIGESSIAGRPTYVFDLGPNRCSTGYQVSPSGTVVPDPVRPPDEQGKHLVWIDKQTLFFLKSELYNHDGTLQARNEVTEIEYNVTNPNDVYSYTPPVRAAITDLRPQPYTPR